LESLDHFLKLIEIQLFTKS